MIGLGININSFGRVVFDPATLFANGEQGAFYLPEPQYLYQDSAGTTPVTADGDPVGLMLDKSKSLGPELADPTQTYDLVSGDGDFDIIADNMPLVAGERYLVSFYKFDHTAGTPGIALGGANNPGLLNDIGVNRLITIAIVAGEGSISGGADQLAITGSGAVLKISNVSVKKVNGNEATQSTSASRRLYKINGSQSWLLDDLVDDGINAQLPDLGTNATLAYADGSGVTILTGQTISGATPLPTVAETYGVIYLDRPLTASETESVTTYLNGLRGA